MTRTTCPLGDDCDLTVAWMAGRESAKDELEAKQQETFQMYVDANEARIDAEAKLSESEDLLAKAQGALHQIAGKKDYADDPWGIARTTLAELKGQDDGQAPHAG
jgi:hypothetical protein